MTNKEMRQFAEKRFLTPWSILQLIGFYGLIASPFLWIWLTWGIAWKVGLSGIILIFVSYGVYKLVKEAINKAFPEDEPTV